MKPFDLDKALAGARVVTRDGRPVKIAGYNPEFKESARILGWIGIDSICSWNSVGKYRNYELPSEFDLFIALK